MLNSYNPFDKKELELTEHGTINYQHGMGITYVTHRRKEHYFKKYQGFAISNSELETAYNKRAYWILILYHRDDGTSIPYRYKMENTPYLEEYNNNGDKQKVFPIKQMQTKKNGEWQST